MLKMEGFKEFGKFWISIDLPFWNDLPESTQNTLSILLGVAAIICLGAAIGILIVGIVKYANYSRLKAEGELDTKAVKPFKQFGWCFVLFGILLLLPFITKMSFEIAKSAIGV